MATSFFLDVSDSARASFIFFSRRFSRNTFGRWERHDFGNLGKKQIRSV